MWYISGIYCQLGDYLVPTTYWGNQKQLLTFWKSHFRKTSQRLPTIHFSGAMLGWSLSQDASHHQDIHRIHYIFQLGISIHNTNHSLPLLLLASLSAMSVSGNCQIIAPFFLVCYSHKFKASGAIFHREVAPVSEVLFLNFRHEILQHPWYLASGL